MSEGDFPTEPARPAPFAAHVAARGLLIPFFAHPDLGHDSNLKSPFEPFILHPLKNISTFENASFLEDEGPLCRLAVWQTAAGPILHGARRMDFSSRVACFFVATVSKLHASKSGWLNRGHRSSVLASFC